MMTQRQLEEVTREELGRSHLGHAARNKRLVEVGGALAVSPGASLPKAFEDWAGLKGAYRLLSHEAVSHPAILRGHVQATIERCQQHPVVLCVQDTTSLIFAHAVEGDGIINHMKAVHGVIAHTALAVSASDHEVLGVLSQQVWARQGKVPAEETASQRQHRRRESEKWSEGVCQVSEALVASVESQRPRVLHVFDKEGDNFEAMEVMEALGDSFVIRVNSNRLLETAVHGGLYLQQAAEHAPVRGHYLLQVPRGMGRAPRQARLQVRACTVAVRSPRLREHAGDALKLNVVLAQEVTPPRGVKPLHWCLMTREPIATWQQCLEVIRAYEGRWCVEEFHMGLKTGCALESHQLKTLPRMENLLAVCSVIAWGMLALRDAARQVSPPPASRLLSHVQLALLRRLRPKLSPNPNTHQALRALASLGGFIGRKGDGEPGWRTLWAGWQRLLQSELGYRAALDPSFPSSASG
jgi:hypothetical protein